MFFKGQVSGVKKRRVVKAPLRRKRLIRRKRRVKSRKGRKRRRR